MVVVQENKLPKFTGSGEFFTNGSLWFGGVGGRRWRPPALPNPRRIINFRLIAPKKVKVLKYFKRTLVKYVKFPLKNY